MAKYKTVFILLEDSRDTSMVHGNGCTGDVFYSLDDVCIKILKRQWYFNPDQRKWIKEMWKEHGPVKAFHSYTGTAWLYCPTYIKKRIKL